MALPLAAAPARAMALGFSDVSLGFALKDRLLPVLEGIDLAIAPGAFVALLGPSGCGKSTLLRLAAGLERPTRGQVLEDGRPITGPDPRRILVFQDPTLFPWRSVWKNVAFGLEARGLLPAEKGRVDAALALVQLGGFAEAHPHQLSGGMAQRVALARALVNDPELLLLDEPFGRLDSLTRLTMQTELLALWRKVGFTALMVTHDVEEALLLADRVIVLSDRPARIVAEVTVQKPHPRRRDDAELIAQRRFILEKLGFGAEV